MEYFSNKLFSGMPFEDAPGEKGYVTKLIEAVADKMGKSDTLKDFVESSGGKALGWITDKVGEGLEEVVTGLLDPAIDWATYDTDAKIDSLAEEFVGGFMLAMLMTGGEALIDNVNTTRTGKDYNLDKDTVQALLAEAKSVPQLQADPAETRRIYEALGLEAPETQNTAPEGAAESVRAGQVTVIQHPYSGEVPVQESVSLSAVSVPDASVQRANALINAAEDSAAQGAGSFKTTLTRLYQQIFQRSSGIPVEGLTFQGKQYLVEIGNKVPGKVISDPNLSAEKLALLDDLPEIVKHAEYVGSAQYLPNAKSKNSAIRYDYFETPVKISGQSYIAKFDVEVIPGANNYRTHQIVNVDLTSTEARLVGPAPTPSSDVPSLRNENISQQASAVNRSTGDSSDTDIRQHRTKIVR